MRKSGILPNFGYNQDIYDRDTKTLKQLEADPSAMEKVARERYFMKRPTEDVYIIK